ncbi:MAG: multidrug efflux SMR transporter [Drouetiella hepatica Uher 2000/2452]|jgi:multidrug transporter EmrE-like cation transporter|uniref:Multidrug efflux SMR transporter n=1 Tax=Drouetiella hepatica Uher 2000/2452 TaxID=904376 RepID=A0A951UPE7_9CYAN|nr:multidrug efflux SMR transporter [Drouetiella hepatica Uher 2000/2452]
MDQLFLFLAIFFEIAGTYSLKMSNGFSKVIYIPSVILAYSLAFTFFGFSLKSIDISIAYAIWSGIGIVGTTLFGILFFNESIDFSKAMFIGLILVGVVGLNFSAHHS